MRLISLLACVVCLAGLTAAAARAADAPARVTVERVPDGGVQAQAAAAADGTVHLIYLKGDPAACDVFYTRRGPDGAKWADPVRVNSRPGSAVALGTVRGAHLALGRKGWVHVAWMGSQKAEPKGPGNATPMLYTRLAPNGRAFEPERNVIAAHPGLDGGGSAAADDDGRVFVGWHAPATKGAGEADRRVWVAASADDGRTFAPETQLSPDPTGACGCCGMRLAVANGRLYALYRSATETVHRDIYAIAAPVGPDGAPAGTKPAARSDKVGPMESGVCVMSTAALRPGPNGVVAAWERDGQIEWAVLGTAGGAGEARATAVPGKAGGRKHPAVAVNAKGEVLVAWAEGTGWNRGGAVAWQVFDKEGKPVAGEGGRRDGLPAWGVPAAVARADGGFVVLY